MQIFNTIFQINTFLINYNLKSLRACIETEAMPSKSIGFQITTININNQEINNQGKESVEHVLDFKNIGNSIMFSLFQIKSKHVFTKNEEILKLLDNNESVLSSEGVLQRGEGSLTVESVDKSNSSNIEIITSWLVHKEKISGIFQFYLIVTLKQGVFTINENILYIDKDKIEDFSFTDLEITLDSLTTCERVNAESDQVCNVLFTKYVFNLVKKQESEFEIVFTEPTELNPFGSLLPYIGGRETPMNYIVKTKNLFRKEDIDLNQSEDSRWWGLDLIKDTLRKGTELVKTKIQNTSLWVQPYTEKVKNLGEYMISGIKNMYVLTSPYQPGVLPIDFKKNSKEKKDMKIEETVPPPSATVVQTEKHDQKSKVELNNMKKSVINIPSLEKNTIKKVECEKKSGGFEQKTQFEKTETSKEFENSKNKMEKTKNLQKLKLNITTENPETVTNLKEEEKQDEDEYGNENIKTSSRYDKKWWVVIIISFVIFIILICVLYFMIFIKPRKKS
ncbi:hypothetical protein CDIK_3057 [Cucumispora dikerogammari]|nr:hypothetical protein CDIK_3057 [Cucumispora dikerogammari]